jgi:predicted O-linked N-acetylglucosamine transferase (SPINDLY family)
LSPLDDKHNCGVALIAQGRWADAALALRAALERDPAYTLAREHLAFALESLGDDEQALEQYELAIPNSERPARLLRRMALIQTKFGRIAKAVELLERARVIAPDSADILSDLGHTRCSLGDVSIALGLLSQAVKLDPNSLTSWSRLLHTSMYGSSRSPEEIFHLHVQAGAAVSPALPESPANPTVRTRASDRIRVAYLSPDFCGHSVMAQIEPVLRLHDRSRFDVICYSDTRRPDDTTLRLQRMNLTWRETASTSDQALVEQIRADEIDILFDLAGHTGQGRLRVLASRPAAIQISAFGFPNTTGLRAVDYRITDSFTDPPSCSDRLYTEKLLRLDPCFFCYQPPCEVEIALPATPLTDRFIFCSFNALPKISDQVIDLWAAILMKAPGAQLMLKALEFAEPEAGSRLLAKFAVRGVPSERIIVLPPSADRAMHLGLYNLADCALDTFPYSGTITSCEALWMGIPVVSMPGQAHVSRVTGSVLAATGLPELIAGSPETYVDLAVREASRGKRPIVQRRTVRETMSHSDLMDCEKYVRKLEGAYQSVTPRAPG